MTESIMYDSTKRHDFTFFFDVTNGNPNGDPDAGNLPRVDPETMHGLVTDGAIKRKIRDWVDAKCGTEEQYKIYVQNKGIALNTLHQRAYAARNLTSTGAKQKAEDVEQARSWMCENFYDIRAFGAVMNTKINCGQVRGPVQIMFARSLHPITPLDLAITRVAITQIDADKTTEIGRKAIVPYALYQAYGFYNPHFAKQTGFDADDLALFWTAMQAAWDWDRTASRGMLAFRGAYIYSHTNPLGNAPAHRLFERVQVKLGEEVRVPRDIADYTVTVNQTDLPEGVTLTIVGS